MTSPAAPSPQTGVGNVHKSGPVQVTKRKPATTVGKKGGGKR